MDRSRQVALATLVAGLFTLGSMPALAADAPAEGGKIKCEGVNSCKGHGSCKSARNACAGKNGCAGQGFQMMTADECAATKAKKAEEKEG